MALPTKRKPKGAHIIHRDGKGYAAKIAGLKESVPLDHDDMTVHLDEGTMFDPGEGQPMVNVHRAYHGKALPPALMKLIEQAIAQYLALHDVHQFAASDQAMPGMDMGDEGEPTDIGAPEGLPTGRMAA